MFTMIRNLIVYFPSVSGIGVLSATPPRATNRACNKSGRQGLIRPWGASAWIEVPSTRLTNPLPKINWRGTIAIP